MSKFLWLREFRPWSVSFGVCKGEIVLLLVSVCNWLGREQTEMLSHLRLLASNPAVVLNSNEILAGTTDLRCNLYSRSRCDLPFSSLTLQSRSDAVAPPPLTSEPSYYSCTVGSSLISSSLQPPHWNLTQGHVTILNVIACVVFSSINLIWPGCSVKYNFSKWIHSLVLFRVVFCNICIQFGNCL